MRYYQCWVERKDHFLSQNHRTVGVGRDLCGSSSPTRLPKQGHLEQAAEDLVQAGLEYLQRKRLWSGGFALPHAILMQSGDCWPLLTQGCIAGLLSFYCSPGPPILPCQAVFQPVGLQPFRMHGVIPSQVRDSVFLFVEIKKVLHGLFSSSPRFLWMAAQPSC